MNPSLDNISKKFTAVQAFTISMIFSYELWPLVEAKILQQESVTEGMHSLFFTIVCTSDECSAEWNESRGVLKKEHKNLKFSLTDVFACALAFIALYNERYNSSISCAVSPLENILKNPNDYSAKWRIWDGAVKQTILHYLNSKLFDWSATLPEGNN